MAMSPQNTEKTVFYTGKLYGLTGMFGRHGDAFGMTENAFFSCIYNFHITVSPTSSFSASFNGNCVKNRP